MPYEIEHRDDHLFCIVKKDGETVACHDTWEQANDQLTALNINVVSQEKSLKRYGAKATVTPSTVSGYLVRFTDATDRDLYNEYFDKQTDFHLEAYPIKGKPILIEHGLDDKIGVVPVGVFEFANVDDVGIWVEGKLKDREDYLEYLKARAESKGIRLTQAQLEEQAQLAESAIRSLVTSTDLQWSSGALYNSVKVDENGHIKQWCIVEGSLTVMPAEPNGTNAIIRSVLDLLEPTAKEVTTDTAQKSLTEIIKSLNGVKTMNEELVKMCQTKADELMQVLAELLGSDIASEEEVKQAMADGLESELEVELPVGKSVASRLEELEEKILAIGAEKATELKERAKSAQLAKAQHAIASAKGKSKVPAYTGGFNILTDKRHTPFVDAVKSAARQQRDYGDGDVRAYEKAYAVKAQNPYIGTYGGYLVGQELAPQILEPLRASVVGFQAGVRQTLMQNIGIYTVPKMTTAPSAYRPGINTAITGSQAEFDLITAFMRPIAVTIDIPKQMLLTTPLEAEQRIREQAEKSIRLQIDKEIFIGTGAVTGSNTGAEIKGILNTLQGGSLSTTNVVTLATNGRQPNYDDLVDAETQLAVGNVEPDETWAWVMNPRTRGTFRSLTDTTGRPLLYQDYGQSPYEKVLGYKTLSTTQIPTNITTGTSTDTSYVFLGRFDYAEYVMANDISIIVDEFSQASSLVTRITLYTFSDFIIHYPEAFYVMAGVRA